MGQLCYLSYIIKKNKSRKRAKRSYLLKCYVIGVIFSEAISESE